MDTSLTGTTDNKTVDPSLPELEPCPNPRIRPAITHIFESWLPFPSDGREPLHESRSG